MLIIQVSGEVHTDNFNVSFYIAQGIWKSIKKSSGQFDGIF